MPLTDIWSRFRRWGVMSREECPVYQEMTEEEILAALPAMCRRRGDLIRAAREERKRPWRVDRIGLLEQEIDSLVLAGDLSAAAEVVRRKSEMRDNWDRDVAADREREREIEKEHARVGDYIQTLINRLSGLGDDGS